MSHKRDSLKDLDSTTYNHSERHSDRIDGRPATELRLVTVEQEQRRLDTRRRVVRALRKLDRQRRLQAAFGSWQPRRDRTTLN